MRTRQYTLTAQDVQAHARDLCQRYLRLRDHGPKCTAVTLLTVLFYAAARITSLAAACRIVFICACSVNSASPCALIAGSALSSIASGS